VIASHFCGKRLVRAIAAWGCAAALAACGGGLYLGVELGGSDDDDPSVALTAPVTEAPARASVRFVAAASDDFGVDAVSLYREDAQGALLLATDGREPYEFDVVIPASAPGTVWRYFARAIDGAGQTGDSAPVDITVR
jgi:chitinase